MSEKLKPTGPGYWAAKDGRGKLRVFETAVIGKDVKVLHKNWRTIAQVEESFGFTEWLGQVTEALFEV